MLDAGENTFTKGIAAKPAVCFDVDRGIIAVDF